MSILLMFVYNVGICPLYTETLIEVFMIGISGHVTYVIGLLLATKISLLKFPAWPHNYRAKFILCFYIFNRKKISIFLWFLSLI